MRGTWQKQTNNRKAVAIIRRSSHKQDDNSSAEIQLQSIQGYCQAEQLELVKVEEFIESAKNANKRPLFNRVKDWALKNNVTHLVFYMQDREARNLTDFEINQDLVRAGIFIIHYANGKKVLHKDSPSDDWFMSAISTVLAKEFSSKLSERVLDAMELKAKTGWFPGNKPTLGYVHRRAVDERGAERKRGTIIVPTSDDQILRLVRREFQLRAEGYSLDLIRTKTIEEGLVPAALKRAYSRAGIDFRLKNKFYRGRFDWRGEEYVGNHELIIDRDILDLVDAQMGTSNAGRKCTNTGNGVFSGGWIRCGHPGCGLMLTLDPKTKTYRSGESKTYPYYRCANSRKLHRLKYVTEEDIMKQFAHIFDKIEIPELWAKQMQAEFQRLDGKTKRKIRDDHAYYRKELVRLEADEDNLFSLLNKGTLDDESYKRQMSKIRKMREQYTQFLEEDNVRTHDEFKMTVDRLFELATRAKSLWENATAQERLQLLKSVCSNPTLDGPTVRYELRKPFSVLSNMTQCGDWRSLADSLRNDCFSYVA